jgi:hypothetical protein
MEKLWEEVLLRIRARCGDGGTVRERRINIASTVQVALI